MVGEGEPLQRGIMLFLSFYCVSFCHSNVWTERLFSIYELAFSTSRGETYAEQLWCQLCVESLLTPCDSLASSQSNFQGAEYSNARGVLHFLLLRCFFCQPFRKLRWWREQPCSWSAPALSTAAIAAAGPSG